MDLDRLYKNFECLPDWQDRYHFIIDMGKSIEKVPQEQQTEEFLVPGCISSVYMISSLEDGVVKFIASSDAMIVNGLIAILHVIYDGKTPEEIKAVDSDKIFRDLGLDKHITPNRRNGFVSIVERLKTGVY